MLISSGVRFTGRATRAPRWRQRGHTYFPSLPLEQNEQARSNQIMFEPVKWYIPRVQDPVPVRSARRICFLLRVRRERAREYRERHSAVWPEMRDALSRAGWRNYSLFLADDGLLVGYVECEDFAAAQAAMQAEEVNALWQAEMAPFFELSEATAPDAAMTPLPEIFHLD